MAEFLIKRVDATNPDLIKDCRGCYKRGDVVQIYEDGECKESPSPNSKMLIVKVPGMKKVDVLKYVESETKDDITIRRRRYHLDFTNLTLQAVSDLETKREATVTAIQARESLKLKV